MCCLGFVVGAPDDPDSMVEGVVSFHGWTLWK